ncbi:MAG: hypothetical protein BVN33_15275 [Proteobacteria bacterium ST_bin13]|nr:MAG: hypothetical protein BVN33_15275 [Proteobacteria bacterium ST_bin13]
MHADGCLAKVGSGSGFFYRIAGRMFLVTCWHVLTGRNPDNVQREMYQQPDVVVLYLPKKKKPEHFLPGIPIPLYNKGKPIWYEPRDLLGRVDLAMIPLENLNEAKVFAVNDHFEYHDIAFEPGKDVTIIGYPFGMQSNPFPIWKRAAIASEPGYTTLGKRVVLLDTPGRPGMSGAPIFFSAPGINVDRETAAAIKSGDVSRASDMLLNLSPEAMGDSTVVLEFCGVYAGSYGDAELEKMNLGRMIPLDMVSLLLKEPKKGSNTNYNEPIIKLNLEAVFCEKPK